jgi:hypothetical protein
MGDPTHPPKIENFQHLRQYKPNMTADMVRKIHIRTHHQHCALFVQCTVQYSALWSICTIPWPEGDRCCAGSFSKDHCCHAGAGFQTGFLGFGWGVGVARGLRSRTRQKPSYLIQIPRPQSPRLFQNLSNWAPSGP